MNNLRIAQRAYDDMNEPEYYDFDSDPMFLEFVEYVTLKLLAGEDQYGIKADGFMSDLNASGGGYQLASERVYAMVSGADYAKWLQ